MKNKINFLDKETCENKSLCSSSFYFALKPKIQHLFVLASCVVWSKRSTCGRENIFHVVQHFK